jgi:hypothetical protein
LSCFLALAIVSIPAAAADYGTAPSGGGSSNALTDFLHNNRLPLVGAQVVDNAESGRQVVLYGFVATAFGKTDAETKARKFLKDPDIAIDNRIKIRPELLSLKHNSTSSSTAPPAEGSTAPYPAAPPPGSSSMPPLSSSPPPQDLQSYQNQPGMNPMPPPQAMQQQNPDWTTTVMPLIMMGAMMGLGSLTGGGSSFGLGGIPSFGSSSPSYGAPYGSYGSSPYGSPNGAPYGAPPYNPPPSYGSPYP